tara:strand:+ start:71 stop:391 length:321 start_codon:yes stop_codon:yes gene_type:complete
MKKFILIILVFNFVYSCGSVSEGFKLKKGNTGDEFLVEKKNPLVLPPEFNDLPKPGNAQDINEKESSSFEISIEDDNNLSEKNQKISEANSTEEFILKNIKKNESN